MGFYEVWVRSNHYHGHNGLTYSSEQSLMPGQIVEVPLRHETVAAIVIAKTSRPKIKTKPISKVLDFPTLPNTNLDLMRWLKSYYPSPIGAITQQFIPPSVNKLEPKDLNQVSKSKIIAKDLPPLTKDQAAAIKLIDKADTYLLHGRTGSGKTRIYLELTKQELANNRSVLILTPEISLTPQLEQQFQETFPNQVIVVHSNLTPKQRMVRWAQILSSKAALVVIGPRSVVFSPLKNIGLVVIDEAHEPAYKQEQSPYYLTSRVASKLRQLHQAKLVLGTATPLVSDYFLAESRHKPIIRLKNLAKKTAFSPPQITIVDRHDKSLFNRSTYLSQPLIEAIDQTLSANEQSLLYLNRRGTARLVICDNCDWQATCPRCELHLTYHGDKHSLRCHVCGYIARAPISCPNCHNPSVKYLSIGTKAVVEEVERLFPRAKVQRFDTDNLKADRLEQHYQRIKAGEVDILVGTQLLAKGLDLPNLSLVGVLLADTSLQLPDFSANERTYQLLHQVIGRIGRGHLAGKAIIQTYQPDHRSILTAVKDDWSEFYSQELKDRQDLGFPPYSHLLKITLLRASPKSAEQAAKNLILKLPKNIKIEGPAPSFHEKQGGKYRWQIVIKSGNRNYLMPIIDSLPANFSYDLDPIDLL